MLRGSLAFIFTWVAYMDAICKGGYQENCVIAPKLLVYRWK